MLTRAIGRPSIPRSSAAFESALLSALSSLWENSMYCAVWKFVNPRLVTSEPAILMFMYGDCIAELAETVNPNCSIPERGKRTSKTLAKLGVDASVWQIFPFARRFCIPKLPASSPS